MGNVYTRALSGRQFFDKIIADGPYVVEHWDELVGDQ